MIDLSKLTNRTKFRIEKELGFDPKTNSFETKWCVYADDECLFKGNSEHEALMMYQKIKNSYRLWPSNNRR